MKKTDQVISDHYLKIHPGYFHEVITGLKSYEIRKNDRGYQRGHRLHLMEWDPDLKKYTGRGAVCTITSVITPPELMDIYKVQVLSPGFVILGIKNITLMNLKGTFYQDMPPAKRIYIMSKV